jgi:tetratricopeptide (TPR) repeat protein
MIPSMNLSRTRITALGCCLVCLILLLAAACAASAPTETPRPTIAGALLYTRTPTPTVTATPTTHPEVPFQQGRVKRDAWELDQAVDYFSAALDIAPSAAYHASRAEVYRLMGRYDEAAADIEAALALDPGLAEAWRQQALLSRAQGDWDQALAGINRVIELKPHDGAAYVLRAQIHAEGFGKLLQALVDYRRAIAQDPVYDKATLVERWHILAKLGYWEEALLVSQKMASSGSQDPLRYYYRAWSLIQLGRIDQAIEQLLFGIERYPDYPAALYYALGVAYYERQAWAEAVQALEVAMLQSGSANGTDGVEHALDIEEADILGRMGVAYLGLRQCETGAALVERAIAEGRHLSDWYWARKAIEECYIAITPTPTRTATPVP